MFYSLNYYFCNIIKFKKDVTEKVRLVVLYGLATLDAYKYSFRIFLIHNPIFCHSVCSRASARGWKSEHRSRN